jgi:cytochrome b
MTATTASTTATPSPSRGRTGPTILPLRLLHWMLAASFAGAWITAESERWRDVHVLLGYTVFGLVALRLLWHFAAGPRARITAFFAGPTRTWRYLQSLAKPAPGQTGAANIGHNAIGAWAIVAVIAMALVTTATGYMTFQDIGGDVFEELHEGAANALLFAALAHVAWIAGRTLLRRMKNTADAPVTANRTTGTQARRPEGLLSARRLAAAALVAAVAGFWMLALRGDLPALTQPDGNPAAHGQRHGHDRD